MGKKRDGFFLNRIRAHVRVQPPTSTSHQGCSEEPPSSSTDIKLGRRIMVVVDSCSEAKNALLWTLSHCAQPQDSIVLLHILKAKPISQSGALASKEEEPCDKHKTSKAYIKNSALKTICELKRPELKTEMVVVEGDEKAPTIVKEARERGATLLVLGQKKQHATWRLLMIWTSQARPMNKHNVVEYCINNSPCMAGHCGSQERQENWWIHSHN
ncbi:unnamed protein product [Microthlaspi erraticum]|uniref:UspA domain-containing protein n=1 Tax=Microthlaspi erraticum TaxID=1685480 RepID=A0A6D2KK76_9BRAS|nr:unnamed protein product [Microthlaspi erraticum]